MNKEMPKKAENIVSKTINPEQEDSLLRSLLNEDGVQPFVLTLRNLNGPKDSLKDMLNDVKLESSNEKN